MPLPQITFSKVAGGLGRPLPGEDHYSAMLVYSTAIAAILTSPVQVFSLAEAETAGIVGSGDTEELHYQVSEFFRIQPKGVLTLGAYAPPGNFATHNYNEIKTLQAFSLGKLRQIAVLLGSNEIAVTTAIVTAIHARAVELYNDYQPLVVLVEFDTNALDASALGSLADLRSLAAYYVGVIIGRDGAGIGADLEDDADHTVSAIGAALGTLALAGVHESIGWPRKFKPSETELDTPAIGGLLVKDMSGSLLNALNDKGYIFLRRFVGLAGSYWNGAPAAVTATSDYAYLESSRTIDKAVRLLYAALVQEVNGTVLIDAATGKLSETYVEYLKGIGDQALAQMGRDGEVSGFQTIIDPDQDVSSTGTLEVSVELVPLGISRNISVNIGLKTQLS